MPEQNNPSLKTVVVPLCANATASCRQIGQAKMVGETILVVLAEVTGWGYFFCWTACMFPQMHENWRRKSVVGFSFDMLGYFLISYITYLIYNVTVFFKPELIFEKSGEDNPVKLTDVVFAIVAFACTVFQVIQCFIYDRGSQTIHLSTVLTCVGSLVALAALVILKFFHVSSWFLVLQYCGYVKFVISFGTYFPQVWMNYKRKSTIGFHIAGVLLDVGGGVLSILQMFIYCWIEHSIVQVTGNIPKLALGVVTLLFGLVLTWQHYVSYAGNESGIGDDYLEEAPLLRSSVIKMSYPLDMTNETRAGFVKSAIVPLDNYNSERARVKNFFASL